MLSRAEKRDAQNDTRPIQATNSILYFGRCQFALNGEREGWGREGEEAEAGEGECRCPSSVYRCPFSWPWLATRYKQFLIGLHNENVQTISWLARYTTL